METAFVVCCALRVKYFCNKKTTEHDHDMLFSQDNPSCRDDETQKYLQANKSIHMDERMKLQKSY